MSYTGFFPCFLLSVIRYLLSVIRYLLSVICSLFPVPYSLFPKPQFVGYLIENCYSNHLGLL
ncbi:MULTISPECIES: hypothetical protein [unclassified Moorena]|uniref:hypothetical protein n=1 Tax=unclassified Moorena TaxID=2683338 RepID=UPI0013FEA465|nr:MULTISPECIES: hypothetical protein [unclassified Moorena]NEO13681.1 hypothetical protein [Moorena sp. SIO3E8]NEQ03318.1 hypothetical protein [Moorena sp. SIO3F7]